MVILPVFVANHELPLAVGPLPVELLQLILHLDRLDILGHLAGPLLDGCEHLGVDGAAALVHL